MAFDTSSPPSGETLTAVLRHFDWSPSSGVPGKSEIWTPDENADDDEEVLVPLDPERGDYNSLLTRAQHVIVKHYGRAARDILAVLNVRLRSGLTATRWEKETTLDAGIIGWEGGEALYAAARAQLLASAKSTSSNRRYHGNADSYVAKQFIEASYMGQTDVGSFVITAYTPSGGRFYTSRAAETAAEQRPALLETQSVTGAQILDTFERALKAVRSKLDDYRRDPRTDIFLETVNEGVSCEFARALSALVADSNASVTVDRVNGEAKTTLFESDDGPILYEVANVLAANPEPQDVTLVGEVTLLSRERNLPERLIRLNVAEGAPIRKARVLLTPEQYSFAMVAHGNEENLEIRGRLEKDGKLWWLRDPADVRLVPDTEDDGIVSGEPLF